MHLVETDDGADERGGVDATLGVRRDGAVETCGGGEHADRGDVAQHQVTGVEGAGAGRETDEHDPAPRLDELRRAVADVNPSVPVGRVSTLDQQLERNIAQERMASIIGVTLALATLLLAAAGLYSTMAFLVGRRTREIGVRVALGARALDVRRMVLRDAALLVTLGAAAGLGFALWAGRALETLLFGVGRSDVLSMLASAALLSVAGLVASWLPAHRASRVDPVVALREG